VLLVFFSVASIETTMKVAYSLVFLTCALLSAYVASSTPPPVFSASIRAPSGKSQVACGATFAVVLHHPPATLRAVFLELNGGSSGAERHLTPLCAPIDRSSDKFTFACDAASTGAAGPRGSGSSLTTLLGDGSYRVTVIYAADEKAFEGITSTGATARPGVLSVHVASPLNVRCRQLVTCVRDHGELALVESHATIEQVRRSLRVPDAPLFTTDAGADPFDAVIRNPDGSRRGRQATSDAIFLVQGRPSSALDGNDKAAIKCGRGTRAVTYGGTGFRCKTPGAGIYTVVLTDSAALASAGQIVAVVIVTGPTKANATLTDWRPSATMSGAVDLFVVLHVEAVTLPSPHASDPQLLVAIMATPRAAASSGCEGVMLAAGTANVVRAEGVVDDGPLTARRFAMHTPLLVEPAGARATTIGALHPVCARLADSLDARYVDVGSVCLAGPCAGIFFDAAASTAVVSTIWAQNTYRLRVHGHAMVTAFQSIVARFVPCAVDTHSALDNDGSSSWLMPESITESEAEFITANIPRIACLRVALRATRRAMIREDGTAAARTEYGHLPYPATINVQGILAQGLPEERHSSVATHPVNRGSKVRFTIPLSFADPQFCSRLSNVANDESPTRVPIAFVVPSRSFRSPYIAKAAVAGAATLRQADAVLATDDVWRWAADVTRSLQVSPADVSFSPESGTCAISIELGPTAPLVAWLQRLRAPTRASQPVQGNNNPPSTHGADELPADLFTFKLLIAIPVTPVGGASPQESAVYDITPRHEDEVRDDCPVDTFCIFGVTGGATLSSIGQESDVDTDNTGTWRVSQGQTYRLDIYGINLRVGSLSFESAARPSDVLAAPETKLPCEIREESWSRGHGRLTATVGCRQFTTQPIVLRYSDRGANWTLGLLVVAPAFTVWLQPRSPAMQGSREASVPLAGHNYSLAIELQSSATAMPRSGQLQARISLKDMRTNKVAPGATYVLESFFGDDRATARYVTRRAFSPATAGVYVVELGGGDSWLRVTEMTVEGPNAAATAATTVVKLARGTKLPAGVLTASFTAHRLRVEAPSTNRWTSGQWLVFACGESTSSCVNVHDESAVVPIQPTTSDLLCGVAAGLPTKATAVNGEPPAAGGEQAEPCLVTFDYGQRLKASVVDKLDRRRWRVELRSVVTMDGPTLIVPLPVELQLEEAEFTLQLDGRGALSVALGTNNSVTAADGVLIPDYGALLLSSSVTVTLSVPRTADEGGRGSDGLSFQRVSLVAVKTRGNMMDPDICRVATASAENFVHVTPNSGAIIAGKHSAVLKVPSLETFVLDESATHDVLFALCVGPVSGEDGQLRGIAWPVGFAAAPELLPRGPVNPTAVLLARPLHLSTPHCPLIHVHGDAHASASLPPVSNSQRSINVCTARVAMVPCVVASDGSGVRPDPGQSTVIWQPLFGAFAARLPAGETLLTLPPFGQASRAAAAAVTSAEEAHGFYALVLRLDRLLTAGSSSSSTVPQYAPLMGCTPLYGQGPTVAHAEGRAAQGRADIAVGARTHMLTVVDAAARGEDGGNDDNNDPTQDVEAGGVRFTLSSPVILARGIDARWFPWRPDSLSSAAAGTVAAVTASELRSYVMNGNLPMRYGVEARVVSVAKHSDLASDFRAVGIDGPGVLIVVTGTGGGRAADGISVVTIAGVAAVWHDPLLRAFHVAVAATVAHPFRVHAAHLVQRDASCKAPPVDSQYSLYETPPESLLDLRPASRWLPSAVANATGTRSTSIADATLSATFFQVRFHANPISDLEVRLCVTWHVEKTSATPPSDHAAAVAKAKRRGSAAAMVAVTKPLTPKTAAPFLITAHADVVSATMDRLGTRGFFTFTSNVHDPPPNSIGSTALTLAHAINVDAVGRHNIRNPRIGVLPWDADGFAAETLTIPHGTNYCPPVGPRRARRVLPVLRMHSKFALFRGGKSAASTWLFVGSTPGVYCLYFTRHGVSLNAGYVTAPGPLHPLPPVAMRLDSATGAIVVNAGVETDLAVIRAKAIPAPVGASTLTRNWSPDFYLVPTDAAKGRAEAARCDGSPTLTSAVARVVDVTPETAGELASERATMSTTTESIVRVRVQAVTPGMYAVCLHRSHNNELQKALADVVAVPTTHRGLSGNHTLAFDTRPLSSKFFGLVLAEVPSAVLNALRAAQFTLASVQFTHASAFVVKMVGTFASEAFPAFSDSTVAPYGLGHAEIVGVDRSDDHHHSAGTVTSTIAATGAARLVGRVVASKKAHGSHQLHATEILIAFTAASLTSSAALDRICAKASEQQTTDGDPRLVLRFRSAGPTWHRDGNGTLVQDAASPVVLTVPLGCPAALAYHASREDARSADVSPDTAEGGGDLDEVVAPTGTPPVTQPHSFAPSTAVPVYPTVQTGPTITVPVLGELVFSEENDASGVDHPCAWPVRRRRLADPREDEEATRRRQPAVLGKRLSPSRRDTEG
jgi:hypothetical protein